jgi:hypothetical protein
VVVEDIQSPGPLSAYERQIRIRSAGPLGSRHTLLLRVLEVSTGDSHRLAFHTRRAGDYLYIQAPGAGKTLKITYALWNPLHYFGDHDEFFWPVNPPDAAIGAALVHISLPANSAGEFRAQGFLRPVASGISDAALWSSDGRVPLRAEATAVVMGAPGPLVPGVVLVADIFAAKGVFREPGAARRAWWFAQSNPIVLLPVMTLAVMLVLRRVKGRNAEIGRSVAPMYGPPEGLSPAEAGVLIDDRLDPRDITATLIDLAVRGYVRIEETGAADDGRDFIIRLLKPMPEWAADPGLSPHERTMLFHTFYGGHWTKLSSLRLRFYSIVPIMRTQIMQSLMARRFYRVDPMQAQKWRMAGFIAVAAVLLIAQPAGVVSLFDSPLLAAIMIAVSAVPVLLLGRNLTAKTRRGMRAYLALLGLQEFITAVDADRLERAPSVSFDKLLPYAMALGVEHRWAHAFHGIATTSPDWYAWADGHAFDSILFSHRMDALAAHTRALLTARTRGRSFPMDDAENARASAARA